MQVKNSNEQFVIIRYVIAVSFLFDCLSKLSIFKAVSGLIEAGDIERTSIFFNL